MESDEKRQEVAARLRNFEQLRDVFRASSVCAFCEVLGVGYMDWEHICARLADLIDRPTCKMVECTVDHGSRSWGMRCTACGKEFEHVKPGFGWRFCPNCGARVAD